MKNKMVFKLSALLLVFSLVSLVVVSCCPDLPEGNVSKKDAPEFYVILAKKDPGPDLP